MVVFHQFMSMNYDTSEQVFTAASQSVFLDFFTSNNEWDLQGTSITTGSLSATGGGAVATIDVQFTLKRRPTFLVLNILLPVIFLSFLNNMVFIIPVETGGKVGFGVTVLLALTMYLSIVSSKLPSSADKVPLMTIYLFMLLTGAVLAVLMSIVIEVTYQLGVKEDTNQKTQDDSNKGIGIQKVKPLTNSVGHSDLDPSVDSGDGTKSKTNPQFAAERTSEKFNWLKDTFCWDINSGTSNKYKLISNYINLVCLIVFAVVWIVVALGFLISMTS